MKDVDTKIRKVMGYDKAIKGDYGVRNYLEPAHFHLMQKNPGRMVNLLWFLITDATNQAYRERGK